MLGFGVLGHVLLMPGMLLSAFRFVFTAVLWSLILLFSFWHRGEVMQMKVGVLGLHKNQPWLFQVEAGREWEGNGHHFSMQPLQLWAWCEGCNGGATAWAEVSVPNAWHSTLENKVQKRQGCLSKIPLTSITPLPVLRITH